ncbi:MAG: acyl phosphate:glycerol-3-phosphate acyltransferase [Eubacteriales bacterium]|nr:acyl phosphate:glycerol-3-phosphate acyltransferase [Eubacteriales bacterium]
MVATLILIEFFAGSLMFSYWLGRLAGKRLEEVRDGNPGAYNLAHAAGFKWGVVGALLDFCKGYFPLVYFLQRGWVPARTLPFVAIAPVLGHAFSPFLKFKGGKALAVTYGVWSAVTSFQGSLVYAVTMGFGKLCERIYNWGKPSRPEIDAMLDIAGFIVVGFFLLAAGFASSLLQLWVLNFAVLVFKRKRDFSLLIKSKLRGEEVKKRRKKGKSCPGG